MLMLVMFTCMKMMLQRQLQQYICVDCAARKDVCVKYPEWKRGYKVRFQRRRISFRFLAGVVLWGNKILSLHSAQQRQRQQHTLRQSAALLPRPLTTSVVDPGGTGQRRGFLHAPSANLVPSGARMHARVTATCMGPTLVAWDGPRVRVAIRAG